MKRGGLLILFAVILSACTSTPEEKAQAAASFHLGYILHSAGSGYKSVDFGPLEEFYASAEDSTVIGYFLDHSYTGGGAAVRENLCYARFYFPPDLSSVTYHYCHGITWDSARADSTARARLAVLSVQ